MPGAIHGWRHSCPSALPACLSRGEFGCLCSPCVVSELETMVLGFPRRLFSKHRIPPLQSVRAMDEVRMTTTLSWGPERSRM